MDGRFGGFPFLGNPHMFHHQLIHPSAARLDDFVPACASVGFPRQRWLHRQRHRQYSRTFLHHQLHCSGVPCTFHRRVVKSGVLRNSKVGKLRLEDSMNSSISMQQWWFYPCLILVVLGNFVWLKVCMLFVMWLAQQPAVLSLPVALWIPRKGLSKWFLLVLPCFTTWDSVPPVDYSILVGIFWIDLENPWFSPENNGKHGGWY